MIVYTKRLGLRYKKQTEVVQNNTNPTWNQSFIIDLGDYKTEKVEVEVYNNKQK